MVAGASAVRLLHRRVCCASTTQHSEAATAKAHAARKCDESEWHWYLQWFTFSMTGSAAHQQDTTCENTAQNPRINGMNTRGASASAENDFDNFLAREA